MCEPGKRSPYCDLARKHVYRHVNNHLPLRAHLCDHFILCLTTAIVATTADGLGFLCDTAAVPIIIIIIIIIIKSIVPSRSIGCL